MRWFVGTTLGIVVLWCVYLASPYWALYRLAAAVRDSDSQAVAERVNVRALRVSLARQLSDDLAALDKSGMLGAGDIRNAASSALVMADPALNDAISPEGLLQLLRSGHAGSVDAGRPPLSDATQGGDVLGLLGASSWRGFRNVYFGLPPDQPASDRYRLQFRLSRLSWRLISVELPPPVQRRIAERLLRR